MFESLMELLQEPVTVPGGVVFFAGVITCFSLGLASLAVTYFSFRWAAARTRAEKLETLQENVARLKPPTRRKEGDLCHNTQP